MKVEFIVSDMTCAHCIKSITQAVQEVAPDAVVQADLASHRVAVEAAVDPATLELAIREAGYEVQLA